MNHKALRERIGDQAYRDMQRDKAIRGYLLRQPQWRDMSKKGFEAAVAKYGLDEMLRRLKRANAKVRTKRLEHPSATESSFIDVLRSMGYTVVADEYSEGCDPTCVYREQIITVSATQEYMVDFYYPAKNVLLDIHGPVHFIFSEVQESDERKSAILAELGLNYCVFTNRFRTPESARFMREVRKLFN